MRALRIGPAIVLMEFLTFSVAAAAGQNLPSQGPDSETQARVEQRLSGKNIDGVTVAVKDGVATLTGAVRDLYTKNQALDVAKKTNGVTSVADQLSVEAGASDRDVAEQVVAQVLRYTRYTVFDDVNIEVKSGVVTFSGYLTAPFKATDIVNLASRVAGVQAIKNDFVVLPASMADDRLRNAIATQIYNDPMFSNYSIQTNPPIHIIVNNSRVTLTGVVTSQMERMKAESIARSAFGVLSVDNKLKLER